ncbi:hypothetical protein E2C01_028762 [Portunus trituberculatus]|uniref:Uncharacterized protein n=1 Tax=Portunus trituberculatus TaxID=210409 RepID=A0A5B7ELB4_PORTR|nr:hypothetical protein [Portunus trituberculatus]
MSAATPSQQKQCEGAKRSVNMFSDHWDAKNERLTLWKDREEAKRSTDTSSGEWGAALLDLIAPDNLTGIQRSRCLSDELPRPAGNNNQLFSLFKGTLNMAVTHQSTLNQFVAIPMYNANTTTNYAYVPAILVPVVMQYCGPSLLTKGSII